MIGRGGPAPHHRLIYSTMPSTLCTLVASLGE